MLAKELLDRALIESKSDEKSLRDSIEPIKFRNWIGDSINAVGIEAYTELGRRLDEGMNVEELKADFETSGQVVINDGGIVRRIFVSYDEVNNDTNFIKVNYRSEDDKQYSGTRIYSKGEPQFSIIGNTININPAPSKEIENGILMHYIEPYKRLSEKEFIINADGEVTDEVVTVQTDAMTGIETRVDSSGTVLTDDQWATLPDLNDEIFGIPQQHQKILIEGLMERIARAKGDIQNAEYYRSIFQNNIQEVIGKNRRRGARTVSFRRTSSYGYR